MPGKTWRSRWREVFTLDLRSLALFRFLVGSTVAVDVLARFADLGAFYTDWGVMPRDWAVATGGPLRLSLHLANGESWFAALLLLAEAAAAAGLAVGWRTRAASIVTFALHASLLSRNSMILQGGDTLLACLLFWAMFLPVHARWSVDAALSTRPPPEDNGHRSPAAIGLLLQVLGVYFFSVFYKTGPEWWPDGTAIYYALSLERYSSPWGQWLLNFPGLLQGLTYFVYFLELIGPVLALSPLGQRPLRLLVFALLAAMHTGFIVFMEIGPFPFVSLCSLSILLGSGSWDWAGRRAGMAGHVKVYYDRECAFCLKSCLLLRTFLALPHCDIAPAQDSVRANALMQAQYSWVVIDADDVAHTKWDAFVALLRYSPLFRWAWPVARLRVWDAPGRWTYDWVGRHRHAFGALTAAVLPMREVGFTQSRANHVIASFFAVAIMLWNLVALRWLPDPAGAVLQVFLRPLHIDQAWNMFGPAPSRDDGWYVVPGRLENGGEIDVLTAAPVDYAKPANVAATEPNVRWRTYHTLLWHRAHARHREYYARWICRDWNRAAEAGGRLRSFKLVYLLERSVPYGQAPTIELRVLWRHDCLAEEGKERERREELEPAKDDEARPV